jgi:hypothetical protein
MNENSSLFVGATQSQMISTTSKIFNLYYNIQFILQKAL